MWPPRRARRRWILERGLRGRAAAPRGAGCGEIRDVDGRDGGVLGGRGRDEDRAVEQSAGELLVELADRAVARALRAAGLTAGQVAGTDGSFGLGGARARQSGWRAVRVHGAEGGAEED